MSLLGDIARYKELSLGKQRQKLLEEAAAREKELYDAGKSFDPTSLRDQSGQLIAATGPLANTEQGRQWNQLIAKYIANPLFERQASELGVEDFNRQVNNAASFSPKQRVAGALLGKMHPSVGAAEQQRQADTTSGVFGANADAGLQESLRKSAESQLGAQAASRGLTESNRSKLDELFGNELENKRFDSSLKVDPGIQKLLGAGHRQGVLNTIADLYLQPQAGSSMFKRVVESPSGFDITTAPNPTAPADVIQKDALATQMAGGKGGVALNSGFGLPVAAKPLSVNLFGGNEAPPPSPLPPRVVQERPAPTSLAARGGLYGAYLDPTMRFANRAVQSFIPGTAASQEAGAGVAALGPILKQLLIGSNAELPLTKEEIEAARKRRLIGAH